MDLSNLLSQPCEWLRTGGKENDVVISTRFRLARNVKGFPFLTKATHEQFTQIEEHIAGILKEVPELADYVYLALDDISGGDLSLLFERHLISKEHTYAKWRRSVLFKRDESISIMVNEEDHLRIQMLHCGFETSRLWQDMNRLDDLIGSALPYSFHERFGYLTACPSNVGTGMRMSVMLHLPALRITQQVDKIYPSLSKLRLVLRGFYGEGTAYLGDFFQLSNQASLGKTEGEVIQLLEHAIPQILKYEREVRRRMTGKNKNRVEKLVQDAMTQLLNAEALTSEQAVQHLSAVRLGIHLGILPRPLTLGKINELFILAQPAHLQKKSGRELSSKERDEYRASMFKDYLHTN